MKVEEYLEAHSVKFSKHEHPPAYTAQEIAAEEHITGNMLAKPVIVKAGNGYALCVLPASYKLDTKKVASATKAKQVRLADETEMAKLFPDVEVGAEPPFGNLYNLPTYVDEHLADEDEIIFQAGDHRHSIRMSYDDYEQLAQPTVADLAVHI